jgi:peptidoglycan/LPS O-acetylase OafA/YrhL
MVSRDTAVQIPAVVVAMLLAGLSVQFGPGTAGPSLLLGAASYVVVFAGGHAYLALRGDGESVPVAARWRFVALVLAAVAALVVGYTFRAVTVGAVRLTTLLGVVTAALFLAYWLYEARSGYRASLES